MRARIGFAFVWSSAACTAAMAIGASAQPIPSPTASASMHPKLLGRVFVNASCNTFVVRYNVAATTMMADDDRLDAATIAIDEYAGDFSMLDGAIRGYNHRLQLIATMKGLLETIPKTQSAVDDVRLQAKSATDPERRAALLESAKQLQDSVDHQRAVVYDMMTVLELMLDKHSSEDVIAPATDERDPKQTFNANVLDAPVPEPGDAPLAGASPGARLPTIGMLLHFPRERWFIERAELSADAAAARVLRTCVEAPAH